VNLNDRVADRRTKLSYNLLQISNILRSLGMDISVEKNKLETISKAQEAILYTLACVYIFQISEGPNASYSVKQLIFICSKRADTRVSLASL